MVAAQSSDGSLSGACDQLPNAGHGHSTLELLLLLLDASQTRRSAPTILLLQGGSKRKLMRYKCARGIQFGFTSLGLIVVGRRSATLPLLCKRPRRRLFQGPVPVWGESECCWAARESVSRWGPPLRAHAKRECHPTPDSARLVPLSALGGAAPVAELGARARLVQRRLPAKIRAPSLQEESAPQTISTCHRQCVTPSRTG